MKDMIPANMLHTSSQNWVPVKPSSKGQAWTESLSVRSGGNHGEGQICNYATNVGS